MSRLNILPGQLSLAQLRQVHQGALSVSLDESAAAAIEASVACVEQILAEGRTAYGINTGFGLLASTRIPSADLENLQRSLVLSPAAGDGQPVDDWLVAPLLPAPLAPAASRRDSAPCPRGAAPATYAPAAPGRRTHRPNP